MYSTVMNPCSWWLDGRERTSSLRICRRLQRVQLHLCCTERCLEKQIKLQPGTTCSFGVQRESPVVKLPSWVPQGSVLGPLFFKKTITDPTQVYSGLLWSMETQPSALMSLSSGTNTLENYYNLAAMFLVQTFNFIFTVTVNNSI